MFDADAERGLRPAVKGTYFARSQKLATFGFDHKTVFVERTGRRMINVVSQRRTMITLLRHVLAIAILPFTVAVLVPVWIAQRYGVAPTLGRSIGPVFLQVVGLVLLSLGLVLFTASVWRFATEGKGTLAPWDPPRVFVVRGPYRFVRNPMISGVLWCLFGEALALQSSPHAVWAASFLILNLIYIPFIEEPQLERRFGDSYREYRRHVRRFMPRLRPWRPLP
jgi:protein-S-isoprenylcysteine O-methyltransferase Ste14